MVALLRKQLFDALAQTFQQIRAHEMLKDQVPALIKILFLECSHAGFYRAAFRPCAGDLAPDCDSGLTCFSLFSTRPKLKRCTRQSQESLDIRW